MALGKYTYYPIRHRLISFLRDQDIRGIRRLSVDLPKWILPNPSKVGSYILKTIHGFYLRIDPSIDKGVELSLHETGTYEKGILDYLEKNLKKGDCFIDVGANIGVMSLFASQCVGDNGQVFSYEASHSTLQILEENIQLNERVSVYGIDLINHYDCVFQSTKTTSCVVQTYKPDYRIILECIGHINLV